MSLIRKPHELNVQTKIKALIYGQAGTGKTTLALSTPKPLLFDFDGGVHRVNFAHLSNVGTVQIESYQDFLDVLEKEDLSDFETFVIDTGGKCLDYMADYIIRKNPKLGKSNGTLTLQGYGERKAEFSALCKRISLMNKHILFVAHRETRTDGDEVRYVPLFGGSNYDSLVTELDLVGYLEANGRKRVITFDPTSRNDGKNTCNLPSTMDIPVIVDESGNPTGNNNFFFERIIQPYIKRLESRKVEGIQYNEVIENIKEQVEQITDELSANDFVQRIDHIKHIGTSRLMAAKLVRERCTQLGLKFNSKAKVYERS
jgi:hypothetical protein